MGSAPADIHLRHTGDAKIEEKYEVTLSSNYDESGLQVLSPQPLNERSKSSERYVADHSPLMCSHYTLFSFRFELSEEMYIACVIVNESLYDNTADTKKAVRTTSECVSKLIAFLAE